MNGNLRQERITVRRSPQHLSEIEWKFRDLQAKVIACVTVSLLRYLLYYLMRVTNFFSLL